MARIRLPALIILIAALVLSFQGTGGSPGKPSTVVILTIDGTRWDAVEGIDGFARLGKAGFMAKKMRSVFPSQTCPSHASIATGVRPSSHGIVSNQFLNRETGKRFSHEKEAAWLKAPPLWVIAEKAGLRAAVSEWPVSEGEWEGVKASAYRPFDWDNTDREAMEWTLSLLKRKEGRPALIMTWLRACDKAGHDHGPGSTQYRDAAARTGRNLWQLIEEIRTAGLEKEIALLITSDHGMKEVAREIDIVPSVRKKGFYPYIAISGPMALIYTENGRQGSAVLKSLKKMKNGVTVFPYKDVPPEYFLGDSPGVGDIMAISPEGTIFAPFKRGPHDINKGYHGWPPSDPDMCGVFFASGPGVPVITVEEASILDVAPTALKLLGIEIPQHMEGKPLF